MLSSVMKRYILELMKSYHLGWNVIIWDEMLSSEANVIIWDENVIIWSLFYHLGLNVIICDETLYSGTTCYHLGLHVIIWDAMLSSGANVIIWDKLLSTGANVIMVSSGANVIIWCYHVMLSSRMITHRFFIFPENFTHSFDTTVFTLPYSEKRLPAAYEAEYVRLFPFSAKPWCAPLFLLYSFQIFILLLLSCNNYSIWYEKKPKRIISYDTVTMYCTWAILYIKSAR
jgi:hypothetical protein